MQTKLILPFLFIFSLAHLSAQNDLTARLDALLNEAVAKDVFSGNVLIFKDNQPIFQKSVGMADYENGVPNTVETQFSIGSITKLFTKIMVLQLAAEGKISLDDKLGKHLPGFRPEIADRATILHLLHHQSGLGQYYDLSDFNPTPAPPLKGRGDATHIAFRPAKHSTSPLLFRGGAGGGVE